MQNLFAVGVITTILAQASPTPMSSAPSGPDWTSITVQKCALLPRGRRGLVSQGIEIQFVNNARVNVSQVTFNVVYHGKSAVIPDHGTFTPGTVIKHDFLDQYVGDTLTGATPEVCRVSSVTFADGTVSNAPAQPAEPSASPT
ncbi:MAG TPA: hypothetical protein VMA36_20665 [Candidatus Limnocylindria bacterium]|nr:hypothetical protein [Candidatus Limnocylindria bacterium]